MSNAEHIANLESRKADIHADMAWMEEDIERIVTVDQFDNHLDENQRPIHVGKLTFSPSQVLKNCDPIAYNEAFRDWVNSLDFSDVAEWIDLVDELADIEAELTELKETEENL